eukprot:2265386-Rhodomonas_salina.3
MSRDPRNQAPRDSKYNTTLNAAASPAFPPSPLPPRLSFSSSYMRASVSSVSPPPSSPAPPRGLSPHTSSPPSKFNPQSAIVLTSPFGAPPALGGGDGFSRPWISSEASICRRISALAATRRCQRITRICAAQARVVRRRGLVCWQRAFACAGARVGFAELQISARCWSCCSRRSYGSGRRGWGFNTEGSRR